MILPPLKGRIFPKLHSLFEGSRHWHFFGKTGTVKTGSKSLWIWEEEGGGKGSPSEPQSSPGEDILYVRNIPSPEIEGGSFSSWMEKAEMGATDSVTLGRRKETQSACASGICTSPLARKHTQM